MTLEDEIGDGPLTSTLILKSCLVGGGCLSFEIEIADGPGPKLDNLSKPQALLETYDTKYLFK